MVPKRSTGPFHQASCCSGTNNGWAYGSTGWNKLVQNVSREPGRNYRLIGWVTKVMGRRAR